MFKSVLDAISFNLQVSSAHIDYTVEPPGKHLQT